MLHADWLSSNTWWPKPISGKLSRTMRDPPFKCECSAIIQLGMCACVCSSLLLTSLSWRERKLERQMTKEINGVQTKLPVWPCWLCWFWNICYFPCTLSLLLKTLWNPKYCFKTGLNLGSLIEWCNERETRKLKNSSLNELTESITVGHSMLSLLSVMSVWKWNKFVKIKQFK